MKLHELEKNIGATHAKKRVGRGSGSGLGKTSGRGQKGQKARSGVFEGGQLPLYRRLPKRGFTNDKFRTRYAVINLNELNRFEEGTVVTPALLKETGIIKKQLAGIKVLGTGKLEKKLTIQANKFSASALERSASDSLIALSNLSFSAFIAKSCSSLRFFNSALLAISTSET